MDKGIVTKCILCDKKIKMSSGSLTILDRVPGVMLQKEMLSCGLEQTYYICPHCGYKYTVMLTNEEIRMLMDRREKLKGYAGIKNQGAREQKRIEYEALDKEIKEKLDKLNGK